MPHPARVRTARVRTMSVGFHTGFLAIALINGGRGDPVDEMPKE